ncbi:MAG TPA: hypothetical protein VGN91_12020 [Bosea sp. (in: a-proteobacteria)]|nr:hypothetical protein [Bosea sp. (in: a-proteobacteria)]
MPAAGEPAKQAHIELTLDYTDDELARFDTLLAQQNLAENKPTIWEGWPAFIGLGVAVAIGATLLATAGGIVAPRSSAGIAALCFGAYWIGMTAPSLAAGIADKRRQKATYDAFRAEWNGTRLLATRNGVWFRREGLRSFIGRSAIRKTSSGDGLFLLHLRVGQPTMIPLRLLTTEQQEFLAALAS